MKFDEEEVIISDNGLGRAAIVRRSDGLRCIYTHWIWSDQARKDFNVLEPIRTTWLGDKTPPEDLYDEVDPQPGLYGSFDEAKNAVRKLPGFGEPQ